MHQSFVKHAEYDGARTDSYTQSQEPPVGQSMQSALAILDLVVASYPVDTDRVYATGLSMGGFGTWNAVRLRPGQFAAAMPLSGGGNADQGALLEGIPVWAYHGSADSIVPVSGTDDMRDAPSIDVAEALVAAGARVRAFDPVAMEVARPILPGIEMTKDAYTLAKGCDALVVTTEWNEFRQLDLEAVRDSMVTPIIMDGRNIYEPEKMKALGFTYRGVGRGYNNGRRLRELNN